MSDDIKKPYIPFDWPKMGSPLTPYIALKFRGPKELYHRFPNRNNRIYVENAQFDVFDSNGASSATITLCDPDFYNLETIFVKAIYMANFLSKSQGNWFLAAKWGWSYYGQEDDGVGEDSGGQLKTSGVHYYMLKDVQYNLSDIDLKVTFTLLDVGNQLLGAGGVGEDLNVGLLYGAGVSHRITTIGGEGEEGRVIEIGESGEQELLQILVDRLNADNEGEPIQAVAMNGTVEVEFSGPFASSSPEAEGVAEIEPIENIITGKTYWKIIQLLCSKHGVNAVKLPNDKFPEPTDGPASGDGGGTTMTPEYGKYIIAQDDSVTSVVDELLRLISNQPTDAEDTKPTFRWGMLAGGRFSPKPAVSMDISDMDVVFGWIPQPPKSTQDLDSHFRLGRIFTYRPGDKTEIAKGETQILGFSYDWKTRGYLLGLGAKSVYAIASDGEGGHTIFYTEDNYTNRDPSKNYTILNNPTVGSVSIFEVAEILGLGIDINFDSRGSAKELIEISSKAVIINAWNELTSQNIEVNIETPGDPWLDNNLFSANGDIQEDDRLVNIYSAYFKVKIYKLSPGDFVGGANTSILSDIFSGDYMILFSGGQCSHRISAGEYTTSLRLLRAF